jgi:hypothetical protein
MRVARGVKVITPGQRRVFGGEHRKFVPVKNAVAGFLRPIAAFDQLFALSLELLQSVLKCCSVHLAWAVVAVGFKNPTLSGIIRQSGIYGLKKIFIPAAQRPCFAASNHYEQPTHFPPGFHQNRRTGAAAGRCRLCQSAVETHPGQEKHKQLCLRPQWPL